MVATMVRICSVPINPCVIAAPSSGRTGSVFIPVGVICGRVIEAAANRVLASVAEMHRVSRSKDAGVADPNRAAVLRVSISPATRTCAAYADPGRPFHQGRKRQQVPFGDLPVIDALQPFQGSARELDIGVRRVQCGAFRHTKNTSRDHRQSLFCNRSRLELAAAGLGASGFDKLIVRRVRETHRHSRIPVVSQLRDLSANPRGKQSPRRGDAEHEGSLPGRHPHHDPL